MDKPVPPTYRPVDLDREYLAGIAFDRYNEKFKTISRNYSTFQKARLIEDFRQHIRYLQEFRSRSIMTQFLTIISTGERC